MQSLFIDGRQVDFREGETVLEAARNAGIPIPTLCLHRRTGILATCRICVVEIEGVRELQAACALPAAEGMTVRTAAPAVIKARRTIVELLFAGGRHDCDRCDADGDCELQEIARDLGVDAPVFADGRRHPPRDETSPMIVHRPELCILCGRCIAGCRESAGHFVLARCGRGSETRIVADDDRHLGESTCVQCGECVQLCPTGALLDRKSGGHRMSGLERVDTVCPYCGVGCGLTLHVDRAANRVVRVTGTEGRTVNDGLLCVKGRYGFDFIHSPERLTHPLVKGKDGAFRRASWEEAVNIVARRFQETLAEHGPQAIAGLSSAKCTNEENYLFQKLFRQVIGSNSIDHCARLCHSSTVTGMSSIIGSGAMTNDLSGIDRADVIVVTGSDTTTAHPVIAARIRSALRRRGSRLVVIDPRRIDLVRDAALHLRQRPGTDVAVINGLMNIIIDHGLHDQAFIEERCEGFETLRDVVAKYTPERVQEISGIPASLLEEAALLVGGADRAAVFYAMGITQHTTGTDNVRSLVNLQLLCGNIGRRGTGVNPLRGQCNVQGACDMGALPDVLPGYRKVKEGEAGLTATEMVGAAWAGKLKALYVMGENPVLSDPDCTHAAAALERLDFLVVQDVFLTETALLADVVLPSACFAEKDGLFTNTERRVQLLRRAVGAPGEALEDWSIICRVAGALGAEWGYRGAEEIQREIAQVVPSYRGISHERAKEGGLQWPCPSPEHPGTPVLHRESFPIGRARMGAAEWRPPPELPDADYPFVLTTGRLLPQFHTGTMTRRSAGIDALAGPQAVISPEDAETLSVRDGETIEVSSRRGSIRAPARISDSVPPGTVFVPFHFAEAAANVLTHPAVDPEAKIPGFKVCAARVRRA